MMNYIINPAWFYWLSVCHGMKTVVLVAAILMLFPCVGFFVEACANAECSGWDDEDAQRSLKTCKKWFIRSLVLFVVFAFIPSKNTLIEMQVARFATYDNAAWTLDAVKSAVDYIVEAIKELK